MSKYYIGNSDRVLFLLDEAGFICDTFYLTNKMYEFIVIDMEGNRYEFHTRSTLHTIRRYEYISIDNIVGVLRDVKIDKILEDG